MKIITISREFGSGGRELGKRLAEELGIHCYDHEIIELIAKEHGFDERYVANISESASRPPTPRPSATVSPCPRCRSWTRASR